LQCGILLLSGNEERKDVSAPITVTILTTDWVEGDTKVEDHILLVRKDSFYDYTEEEIEQIIA
jgi:hypothetical protein